MAKLRVLLMRNGHTEHDFKVKMDKPLLGEIISHNDQHYDVRFIQYIINSLNELDYILVTAIREVAQDKKIR